jgi:hypothetical protein
MRIVLAALGYFGIVFGVGLLLGSTRVFWLEPRLGATSATLVEAPFLVAAMFAAARWLPRRFALGSSTRDLLGVGLGALALVAVADVTVGRWLRGLTTAEQVAQLRTAAGMVYLVLLLLFAAMPWLVRR